MKRIIQNLRKQPEEVRTHVLHVLTIGAGVILLFLWVYSLGRTVTDADTQKQAKEDLQPFSVLKDNLLGGYNSLSQPASSVSAPEAPMTE